MKHEGGGTRYKVMKWREGRIKSLTRQLKQVQRHKSATQRMLRREPKAGNKKVLKEKGWKDYLRINFGGLGCCCFL